MSDGCNNELFAYYLALDVNLGVVGTGSTPGSARDQAVLNGCDATLVVHRSNYISDDEQVRSDVVKMKLTKEELLRDWQCEVCKICGNPNNFGYNLPDDLWYKLVGDEDTIVCLNCLDYISYKTGINYIEHLSEVFYVGRADDCGLTFVKNDNS